MSKSAPAATKASPHYDIAIVNPHGRKTHTPITERSLEVDRNAEVGIELEAREIVDGAVGGVFAGDPFRVIENEIAGGGGDSQRGVEDLARGVRGVDRDGDRGCGGHG